MNALTVVFAALCIFAIGYRFYGLFIANKVLNLNDARVTPAVKYSDGHDYVDTNKYVLFGHHFAAIAAAGPLLGPVLAAQFGYMPGLLWILIGCVLAGGVHDMVVLFASVRHRGQSLAYIASQEIDKTTGSVAAWAVLAILLLTLAGLLWRTARWERAALPLCFGWQLVLGLCASWSVPLLCAGLVVLALLLVLVVGYALFNQLRGPRTALRRWQQNIQTKYGSAGVHRPPRRAYYCNHCRSRVSCGRAGADGVPRAELCRADL